MWKKIYLISFLNNKVLGLYLGKESILPISFFFFFSIDFAIRAYLLRPALQHASNIVCILFKINSFKAIID